MGKILIEWSIIDQSLWWPCMITGIWRGPARQNAGPRSTRNGFRALYFVKSCLAHHLWFGYFRDCVLCDSLLPAGFVTSAGSPAGSKLFVICKGSCRQSISRLISNCNNIIIMESFQVLLSLQLLKGVSAIFVCKKISIVSYVESQSGNLKTVGIIFIKFL